MKTLTTMFCDDVGSQPWQPSQLATGAVKEMNRKKRKFTATNLNPTPLDHPSARTNPRRQLSQSNVFGFSQEVYDEPDRPTSMFLETVYKLDACGKSRIAVDEILDEVDGRLNSAQFEECDTILETAQIVKLSASSIVSLLGITLAAKSRLKKRRAFYRRALNYLTSLRGCDAASRLLTKYE